MTDTVESVLAEMPLPDTYSHTEVMFRNDKETKWVRREDFDWHMRQQADRLAAAHARDQRHYAEIERTWEWHKQTTIRAMTRAEVAEALLREALPYVATDDPGERAEVIALRTRIAAHLSGATD